MPDSASHLLFTLFICFLGPLKTNNAAITKMNGVIGHDSALQGYTWPETTWTDEMNVVMNHAPDAGSIAQPVDQQQCATELPTSLSADVIYILFLISTDELIRAHVHNFAVCE